MNRPSKVFIEDLEAVIYSITPEESPFVSLVSSGPIDHVFKDWQKDELGPSTEGWVMMQIVMTTVKCDRCETTEKFGDDLPDGWIAMQFISGKDPRTNMPNVIDPQRDGGPVGHLCEGCYQELHLWFREGCDVV